jgi:asparagine synthase (glutamine-hydrolysing)
MQNSRDAEPTKQGYTMTAQQCVFLLSNPYAEWSTQRTREGLQEICVYGRGYGFLDLTYYENETFVAEVTKRCAAARHPETAFRHLVQDINGGWCLILKLPGKVLAAVDRSRSIPLLYTIQGNEVIFASTLAPILKRMKRVRINEIAAAELLLAAYVSGSDTLFDDLYGIQAGEVICIDLDTQPPKLSREFYFIYYPKECSGQSVDELMEELADTVNTMFERQAQAFEKRSAILPLSGGFDSRLIAYSLSQNGVRDIICYTYGARGNPQTQLARQVAEALRLDWYFIPYNRHVWHDTTGSDAFEDFLAYSFSGTACPHLQDFPAILALKKHRVLSGAPFFLPGHVGDAWANEFVVADMKEPAMHPPAEYHSPFVDLSQGLAVSTIVYRHLNLWPLSKQLLQHPVYQAVFDKIKTNLQAYPSEREEPLWQFVEWVLRSRTAHWINNSCRAFEFFGGGFFLCLGDYQIMDFFRKLPSQHVIDRNLYHRTMSEKIFTADIGPLGKIPVISGGTRTSRRKRKIVEGLLALGMYKPLDRVRRLFREPQILAADTWFSGGKRPEFVPLRRALERDRTLDSLPDFARETISPYLKKPVYSIQCNGILAAKLLAHQYAQYE